MNSRFLSFMGSRTTSRARGYRTERQFGFAVGGVFSLLAGWWLYRGRFPSLAPGLLGLGAVLVFFGAVLPRTLVWPNRGWMAMAEAISFVSTRVVLGLVFFFVITPIGVVKRLTGWDPLRRRRAPASSYWRPYSVRQRDSKHYEKMY